MFENNDNNQSMRDPQFEVPSHFDDGYVSGVENVTKGSRGKKAALIGGISAAVLVGGSAAAYGLSDTVKNQVKLRLSKPEKYYAWVNENNAETIGSKAAEFYRKRLDLYEKGLSGELNITFAPTEEGKNELYDELFGYHSSDSSNPFRDIFDKNSEIGLNVEGSLKKGSADLSIGFDANRDRIANFDIRKDSSDSGLFMRIPQLKEQWIYTDLDNIGASLTGFFLGRGAETDMLRQMINDPASFLSPEDLETEVNRYVGVWNSIADDVRIEKKESIDICGITSDYTVAKVEFTEKDVDRLELAMLRELRGDSIIKNIVVDKAGFIEESEYYEDIDGEIAELESDLEADSYSDDVEFTVDTYIDGSGVIRGMSFSEDDNSSTFIIGRDGDNIRGYVSRVYDGAENYRAELFAEEKGKKKYSGEIRISYADNDYVYNEEKDRYTMEETQKSAEITFRDAELVNEEKLYFNCDLKVNIPDEDPVAVSFSTDGKSQKIKYEAVFDEVDYGELNITYSINDKADIEIPDKNGAFVLDPENMEDFEIEDYVSWDEIESFIVKALKGLGVSDEAAESAAKSFRNGYTDRADYVNGLKDEIEITTDEFEDYDDEDNDFSTAGSGFEFNRDDYKYEDYKDTMSEEDFEQRMDMLEEFYKSAA